MSAHCFKLTWLGVIRSRINMARQDHRFHIKGETVKSLGSACTCVLRDLILKEPCLGFLTKRLLVYNLGSPFCEFHLSFYLIFKISFHLYFSFLFCTKWTLDYFIKNLNMYRVSKSQLLRLFVWKKDRRRWFLIMNYFM